MNGDAAGAGEASFPCAPEAPGARTAPAIAMLAPFRKSRRLISRSMPSSRSLFFISGLLGNQGVGPGSNHRTTHILGLFIPPPQSRQSFLLRPDLVERVPFEQLSILHHVFDGVGVPNVLQRVLG